jgi:hypothetical protein
VARLLTGSHSLDDPLQKYWLPGGLLFISERVLRVIRGRQNTFVSKVNPSISFTSTSFKGPSFPFFLGWVSGDYAPKQRRRGSDQKGACSLQSWPVHPPVSPSFLSLLFFISIPKVSVEHQYSSSLSSSFQELSRDLLPPIPPLHSYFLTRGVLPLLPHQVRLFHFPLLLLYSLLFQSLVLASDGFVLSLGRFLSSPSG